MPNRHLEIVIENNIQGMININNLYLAISGYVKGLPNPSSDAIFIEKAAKHTISGALTSSANNICMTATESITLSFTDAEREELWNMISKELEDLSSTTTKYNIQMAQDLSQKIGKKMVDLINNRNQAKDFARSGVDRFL